jgi:CubicO group peptidase (beta-lactamase class C family)
VISEIQSKLEVEIGSTSPGAAIAIARRGEIAHASARGFANLEIESEIEPNTIFRIGSLTKQFVAVTVMMLVERGLLSLDASAKTFLADMPASYNAITLRQLLTHTAGIPNYTDIPGFWAEHSVRAVTPKEASAYFMSRPPEFQPGEHFRYSNSGYVLLGRIVEAVTGRSYGEFLLENILRPLRMDDTYYIDGATEDQRGAIGYVKTDVGYRNAPFMSMTWPLGSGGLASSAIDLAKWQSALKTGQVIKIDALHSMHRQTILNDGSSVLYGIGWMIGTEGERPFLHHSGSIRGFASHMAWYPDEDTTIIVLSNVQSFPAVQFGAKITQEIFGG